MKYVNLTDQDKKNIIEKYYIQDKLSLSDIAKKLDTYSNKVRRDAIRLKIPLRDKSQAQKNALKNGSHKHPTKGTNRSDTTKDKIGKSLIESWNNMDDNMKKKRKQKAKIAWDYKTDDEKASMLKKANLAVRETSKIGSKLEKFLLNELIKLGLRPEFHKEQTLANTKLQIDIYLPTISTAIEVDGPSHFLPVWGKDALVKNQNYDNKKTGLILGKGMFLIRIKQTKDFSPTRAKLIFDKLQQVLIEIQDSKLKNNYKNRTIEIGDNNE
jgi:very-short-patch-repair endonuclease